MTPCSCGSDAFCPCGSGNHIVQTAGGVGCGGCRYTQPQTFLNGVMVERHRWMSGETNIKLESAWAEVRRKSHQHART